MDLWDDTASQGLSISCDSRQNFHREGGAVHVILLGGYATVDFPPQESFKKNVTPYSLGIYYKQSKMSNKKYRV